MELYHDLCPDLRPCTKLTEERRRVLEQLIRQGYDLGFFREIFTRAQASSFLKGGKKNWKAGLDWLLREQNLQKLQEVNYDDLPGAPRAAPGTQPGGVHPTSSLPLLERQAIARMLQEAAEDPDLGGLWPS